MGLSNTYLDVMIEASPFKKSCMRAFRKLLLFFHVVITVLATAHIPNGESTVFIGVCPHFGGRGYPTWLILGYPIWLTGGLGGYPHLAEGGYHHQDWMGLPPIGTGWGYPHPPRRQSSRVQVPATPWAVCLLRSRRRTFLL